MEFLPTDLLSSFLLPLGFNHDGHIWYRESPAHYFYLILLPGEGKQSIEIRYVAKKSLKPGESFQDKWNARELIHEFLDLHGALTYAFEFGSLGAEQRTERLVNCFESRIEPLLEQYSQPDGHRIFDAPIILSKILKPEGFKRLGNYWYAECPEHFYYLQLYSAAGTKYIDVGVTFKRLLEPEQDFRSARHGLIRIHETSELCGAFFTAHEYRTLLAPERARRLEAGIRHVALPLLKRLSTPRGLKQEMLERGPHFVSLELRALL